MRAGVGYTASAVTVLACAVALAIPAGVEGQLAEEIQAVSDGTVRFGYRARPDVEVCDEGVRWGEHHMRWRASGRDWSPSNCRTGYVEVELEFRGGRVTDVEVVRGDERTRDAREMGDVSPGEAAGFLVSLAYRGATADGAEDAIFPAMLADVDGVWRELLDIAKDRTVASDVREQTLFWLGQEAADAVTDELADFARDSSEDQEVRNSAIFALSQRDDEAAVPALMEVARTAEQPETRRTAMFWLAQSEDPRVVAFFEEILLRRND